MKSHTWRRRGTWLTAMLVLSFWGQQAARAFNSCTLSNLVAVAFGPYDPLLGVARDANGSVTYSCQGGWDVITLTLSRGSSSTFNPRTLVSGVNTLGYNLFTTAARTTIWGDGSSGTVVRQILTLSNGQMVVPIYGRIPGGQNPKVGSYSDTVVITIIF